MSSEAGSQITVTLPQGTTAPEWQGGPSKSSTAATSTSGPVRIPATRGSSTCGFFSGAFVNSGDTLRITFRASPTPGAGSQDARRLHHQRPPDRESRATSASCRATRSPGVTVKVGSTAPLATHAVRGRPEDLNHRRPFGGGRQRHHAHVPERHRIHGLPERHHPRRRARGQRRHLRQPRRAGAPCGFFSGAFVNAGGQLRITFPRITNPSSAGPYSLTASTSSDTPVVTSSNYTQDAPETTIDSGPAGPTSDATPTYTFSSTVTGSFECRLDPAAFSACTSPYSHRRSRTARTRSKFALWIRPVHPIPRRPPGPS